MFNLKAIHKILIEFIVLLMVAIKSTAMPSSIVHSGSVEALVQEQCVSFSGWLAN